MSNIKATNKLAEFIEVVTDSVNQKVLASATLELVVDPTTYLLFNGATYSRIVGEFIPDGGYTIEQGQESDRIVFQSNIGETVVAFQK